MNRFAPILLVALTLIVYAPLHNAEFVEWDDPSTITRDPAFNPPTFASIGHYWLHPQLNIYIPLTCTAWGALAAIGRISQADEFGSHLNPWLFHAFNLAIHLINVLLVFKIMRVLSKSLRASLIAAAIFALHPVQVEAVSWATDLKDVLSAMFALLTLLAWLRDRRMLATACLLAACFAKPSAVVMPAVMFIIDIALRHVPVRRSLVELIPCFAIALAFSIIARIVQPPVMIDQPPIWIRPLIALDALAFYLWKLLWPLKLGIDYGRSPTHVIAAGWLAFTWILPIAVAALLLWRRQRALIAGAIIFAIALLPVCGLVPFTFQSLSTVADHYLYLPMIGVCIALAFFIRTHRSMLINFISISAIIACAILSFRQARTWRDSPSLFARAIEVNPNSAMSYTNWAVWSARMGDGANAIQRLRTAVDVDPDYAFARVNLADLLMRSGDIEAARQQYQELFRIYRTRYRNPALADETEAHVAELLRRASTQRTGKP